MSELIVGRRYAKALFAAAKEKGTILEVEQDLLNVLDLLEQNRDFRTVLEHPNISAEAKSDLLKRAFEGRVSEIVLNTLLLTVAKGRETILVPMIRAYQAYTNEELGRAQAVVYSPFPLSDSEKAAIAEQFGKLTNKTITLTNEVKPELIGGIQVRIGDKLYDGSLAGKLKSMERSLTQNAM
jgi:F-type H+-transporting ATPase subunit delta